MRAFDASSIIHAWDNYPNDQFVGLWDWLGTQLDGKKIRIPSVAYEEIERRSPDCHKWLSASGHKTLPLSSKVLAQAKSIKEVLGIVEEQYFSLGVSENDLYIIATAKVQGCILVSDEAAQPTLPKMMARYKIPAVCALDEVGVDCQSFLRFIKQSGQKF